MLQLLQHNSIQASGGWQSLTICSGVLLIIIFIIIFHELFHLLFIIFNALASSADMLNLVIIIKQVPGNSVLKQNGRNTCWKQA